MEDNGQASPRVMVDGVSFPRKFETNRPMAEQVQCIKDFPLNSGDVLVCAYPKCGTHWVWEIVSMLMAGSAKSIPKTKELSMMEAERMERLWAAPSPRVLNTHVPVFMLPAKVEDACTKIVHVHRNVKDVVVSKYFHLTQYAPHKHSTIDSFVDSTIASTDKDNYVQYLLDWDQYIKEHPNTVFSMSYEDNKSDPVAMIERLASFLGVTTSADLVQDIAHATSFQQMKSADGGKERRPGAAAQMYRKGEVGDWKNHLTVAQSERLDTLVDRLQGTDYKFRYTL